MRRRQFLVEAGLIVLGAVAAAGTLPAQAASARPAAPGGAWGSAIEIPGLGALNTGGAVKIDSVSCGSTGDCAVGGSYRTHAGQQQAFVASETDGTWETAIQVPGIAALNAGGQAEVSSVSCARAGGCAAGGVYTDASDHQQAFVTDETGGSWGSAIEVPGSAALNASGQAQISSVSCPSTGNCVAGGSYNDSDQYTQAFVVSERNGTWGTAIQIPFKGTGYYPEGLGVIGAISCPSVGNCVAGGNDSGPQPNFYKTSAFVVDEKNGHWGKVLQVPGLAALNYQGPGLNSLSCGSPGNCAAAGYYLDRSGRFQPFVVNEKNGTWGKAIEVPGSAARDARRIAMAESVSCASAGHCAAGGFTSGSVSGRADVRGFVVSQVDGNWDKAIAEPGAGPLFQGRNAEVRSVSCASPGNCVAGGGSKDGTFISRAFVLSERNGTWAAAIEVPGVAALNVSGPSVVNTLSCARGGGCVAAGTYRDSTGAIQGFVVSQSRAPFL